MEIRPNLYEHFMNTGGRCFRGRAGIIPVWNIAVARTGKRSNEPGPLESSLYQGALPLAVLMSADREQDRHELLARLAERELSVDDAALQQALRRLVAEGFLTSRRVRAGGQARRCYRVTTAGRRARRELGLAWQRLAGALSPLVGSAGERVEPSSALQAREREVIERLDEVERLRSEFLYAVAHELRTPLTLVRTATGLLVEGGRDAATQQRLVRDIRQSVDQLHTLVTDLLDLARLRGGKLDIQLGFLDFGELVRDVADRMKPLIESKQQRLTVDAPAVGPRLLGDRRRLEQVLLNLLSNAHKFSPANGQIDVRVEGRDDQVSLTVADTGPGIPEDDQSHLFERFWVGRAGAGQGAGGSGLGLPIVKGLVEAHGGRIWVASAPGAGASFHVLLPKEGPDEDPRR